MKQIRAMLLAVLCAASFLCGCRPEEQVPAVGYTYTVRDGVIYGERQGAGEPTAYTYRDGSFAPLDIVVCNLAGRTVHFAALPDGSAAWFPYTDDGFSLLRGCRAGKGYYLCNGTLYELDGQSAVTVTAADVVLDLSSAGLLYRAAGKLYRYDGEISELAEGRDGWFAQDGTVVLGDGGSATLRRPEEAVQTAVFPGSIERSVWIRGTTVCLCLHVGGGISVYDPFSEHMGLLDLEGLISLPGGETAAFTVSPNGQYLLLEDYDYIYRIGIYDDSIALVDNTMPAGTDSLHYASCTFLSDGEVLYTQQPGEDNEFEAGVFQYEFEDETIAEELE